MPYYSFCVLAGVDRKGCGAIYTYDAVGSFERVAVASVGGSQNMILPILDKLGQNSESDSLQVWDDCQSPTFARPGRAVSISLDKAISTIRRAALAASERDIRLGDSLEVVTIRSSLGTLSSLLSPSARKSSSPSYSSQQIFPLKLH